MASFFRWQLAPPAKVTHLQLLLLAQEVHLLGVEFVDLLLEVQHLAAQDALTLQKHTIKQDSITSILSNMVGGQQGSCRKQHLLQACCMRAHASMT